jgi:hypothetical protein
MLARPAAPTAPTDGHHKLTTDDLSNVRCNMSRQAEAKAIPTRLTDWRADRVDQWLLLQELILTRPAAGVHRFQASSPAVNHWSLGVALSRP